MSGDYADAIAEGATLVRVGTALFGPVIAGGGAAAFGDAVPAAVSVPPVYRPGRRLVVVLKVIVLFVLVGMRQPFEFPWLSEAFP